MSKVKKLLRAGADFVRKEPHIKALEEAGSAWSKAIKSPTTGKLKAEANEVAKAKLKGKKFRRARTQRRAESRASDRELRRITQRVTDAKIQRNRSGEDLSNEVSKATTKEIAKRTGGAALTTATNFGLPTMLVMPAKSIIQKFRDAGANRRYSASRKAREAASKASSVKVPNDSN